MSEFEKLQVLLPHWMEHNSGHEAECTKWSEIARGEGKEKVADLIDAAVKAMKEANGLLGKALEEAGGASDHHHHHSHD
jgi:hypothetical protein